MCVQPCISVRAHPTHTLFLFGRQRIKKVACNDVFNADEACILLAAVVDDALPKVFVGHTTEVVRSNLATRVMRVAMERTHVLANCAHERSGMFVFPCAIMVHPSLRMQLGSWHAST